MMIHKFKVNDHVVPAKHIVDKYFMDDTGSQVKISDKIFVVEQLREDNWSVRIAGINTWWLENAWDKHASMFRLDEIE
jgi:hypothetical protein